jgi:ribose 5-phosphate isomerase B
MPTTKRANSKSVRSKIFIGADHAGFKLKEAVKKWLSKSGYTVVDCGAVKLDPKDDYPDYAAKVAKKVVATKNAWGILVCGSSEGVCLAANKVTGIRAVNVYDVDPAKKSREHLDANVLCLSGWYLWQNQALSITKTWLTTPFSGEARHVRRIAKIAKLEK